MRYGLPLSLVLHVTVLLAVLVGWPGSTRPIAETTLEVPVEIVRFDASTNPPPGRKPDYRDEREPQDDETAAKNSAAQGGRTEPRDRTRDRHRFTRPHQPPEPPQPEIKEAPRAPEPPAATPETERRQITAPETPPDLPQVAMREPPKAEPIPDTAKRRDNDPPLAKRPDAAPDAERPQIRDAAPVPPKPEESAKRDQRVAAPSQPPSAPKIEHDEAALRAPPKMEPRNDAVSVPDSPARPTYRPEPAPKLEQHETALRAPPKAESKEGAAAVPKVASRPAYRPEPPPKANPQEASLRAPSRPDSRSEAAEPRREEAPRVKSRPTFRPEPEPKDTREAKAATPDKRPADFDSVLRSLDKDRKAPREAETERTARLQPPGVPDRTRPGPLTQSEMDAVRRQLRPCWNMDAAAREMETLVVSVEVELDRDGGVREARVAERGRMARDGAFRAAAEAALRALHNPRCTPLRLPAERYDHWRSLIIVFDPKIT